MKKQIKTVNLFKRIITIQHIDFRIIVRLYGITSKEAKIRENEELKNHFNRTGEIPEGNKDSFDIKKLGE